MGKETVFITLNDGQGNNSLQVVVQKDFASFAEISKCKVSTSFKITGKIVKSPKEGQLLEMQIDDNENHKVEILGKNLDTGRYPMSKKSHGYEHLRKFLHLRPRQNIIAAATRVRNAVSFATHLFFQSNGFQYIHTPIITGQDCEGAGEMFRVTNFIEADPKKIPIHKKKKTIDWKKDFFKKEAFLTVSGQLNLEPFACQLTNVYTFGPTFRQEDSHTTRHLSEFWMIEPEMAFVGLKENMAVAEAYTKFCIEYTLENCRDDIDFFNEKVFKPRFNKKAGKKGGKGKDAEKTEETEAKEEETKEEEKDLIKYLTEIISKPFARMTYTEGVDHLLKAIEGGRKFEFPVAWGEDLKSEHERYLCEEIIKGPVFLYNYPAKMKAFYMRNNDDGDSENGQTCQATDLLVPLIGELIGGSVREERLDVLLKKIKDHGLDPEPYEFYTDLRKYGSVPHAGFGLGLERLILMITGLENIREVIPYPRAPGLLRN